MVACLLDSKSMLTAVNTVILLLNCSWQAQWSGMKICPYSGDVHDCRHQKDTDLSIKTTQKRTKNIADVLYPPFPLQFR